MININMMIENNINNKNSKTPEDYLNPKINKVEAYSPNSETDTAQIEQIEQIEIRLDANESFANLPDYIIKDIQKNIENIDFNRYPDPYATNLIKKYAAYLKISENADIDIENIAAGNGSDELLSIIINAFLSKGDKILTFTPDFSMYAFYGDTAEAEVIKIQKSGDNNFAIDFDAIAEKINKENIKIAVFSNPCNPTGQLESKEVLKKFIKSADCVVVLDEVYMTFADGKQNQSFLYDFLEYPNLIVIKSLSKAVGLAAVRVGFALSNETFINMIKTLKSPYNLNAVSQKIAETVINYHEYLDEKLRNIKENKEFLQTNIKNLTENKKNIKIYNTETNFILIETDKINEAQKIFGFLLANKIRVRNLGKGFLRITTGSREENERLIEVFRKYF